jgi:hypothetical protein
MKPTPYGENMYDHYSYPEGTYPSTHHSTPTSHAGNQYRHYPSRYVLHTDHGPVELVAHPHSSFADHPYYNLHHPYTHTRQPHAPYAKIHHATPEIHQVLLPAQIHPHGQYQSRHCGHILHFKKIVATSDTSKTHWIWHITNEHKEVIKTSEHIHRSFETCLKDARHYDSKIVIEHDDIEKTSWIWVITDHHGLLVKKSTRIHATFMKCVEDIHQQNKAH